MLALVVDDSAGMCHMQRAALERAGWQTQGAANGAEALKLLGGPVAFQAVLTNWHMPVMDGLQLLAALRGMPRYRTVPVVLISSDVEIMTAASVAKDSPTKVLMKPVSAEALVSAVSGLLPAP